MDKFLKKSLKFVEDNEGVLKALGVGGADSVPIPEVKIDTLTGHKIKYIVYIATFILTIWSLLLILVDIFFDEKSTFSKRLTYINNIIFGKIGVIPFLLLLIIAIVMISFVNTTLTQSINDVANSIIKTLDRL